MDATELDTTAAAIAAAGRYLTLGTADAAGRPWVSPVWYAHTDAREFVWVSDPGARHSRNIAERPEISLVIFDSGVELGTGSGVYATARAELIEGEELERGIARFSAQSLAQGGVAWSAADVRPPERLRIYRAVAVERYLGLHDQRHALPR